MSSDKQIEANQANAKLSSGPKSEEGKRRSSMNALKDGCCAGRILIKNDLEQAEFDSFERGLRIEFQPSGETQEKLFSDLLLAAWNERRCQKTEVELLLTSTADVPDPMLDPEIAKQVDRLNLYARRYNATFHRSLKALRQVQTEAAFRLAVLPIGHGMQGINVDEHLGMADSIKVRKQLSSEMEKVVKAQAMAQEQGLRGLIEGEINQVNKLAMDYQMRHMPKWFGKNEANSEATKRSR